MEDGASPPTRADALKTCAWGLVWVAGALWFVLHGLGNPLTDFRLMRSAETVVGQVVDAFEDVEEAESGQDNWFSVIAYRFWLRDGREFVGKSQGPGRLPEHLRDATLPVSIDVEYLLADPSVNRLAGDGSQSMSHMLFRWSLGLFLFVMCARPGVAMLRDGLFAYRNASSRASDGAVENGSEVRASSS